MADMTITQAFATRRSVREFQDTAVSLNAVKKLVWAAQGITGDDGKRTVPSAHALYPLRLLLAAGHVDGLDQGLYAVEPKDLRLKSLEKGDVRLSLQMAAIDQPHWIMDAACIIVICADMITPSRAFSEQRPYGQRGLRYVYLEAGAAAQNIQLGCMSEGLGSVWVGGFNDEATAEALGLDVPLTPIVQVCIGHPASEREARVRY